MILLLGCFHEIQIQIRLLNPMILGWLIDNQQGCYTIFIDELTDMEKQFLYTSKVSAKTSIPKKLCKLRQKLLCDKTKKNVFEKSMSNIRLPHIYRGKN